MNFNQNQNNVSYEIAWKIIMKNDIVGSRAFSRDKKEMKNFSYKIVSILQKYRKESELRDQFRMKMGDINIPFP